jgi:hypothetical protein
MVRSSVFRKESERTPTYVSVNADVPISLLSPKSPSFTWSSDRNTARQSQHTQTTYHSLASNHDEVLDTCPSLPHYH